MEWRNLIIECLQSGQSKTEWCKVRGISTRQFYYWQKIIREEELALIDQNNLPNMFPAVTATNSTDLAGSDFYEIPAEVSDQIISAPTIPNSGSVKPMYISIFDTCLKKCLLI